MSDVEQYEPGLEDKGNPKMYEMGAQGGRWVLASAFDALKARLEALESSLKDSAIVHTNILRGTIALTKAQAIHIAGLPADIAAQLEEALRVLRRMVNSVERCKDLSVLDDEMREHASDARAVLKERP